MAEFIATKWKYSDEDGKIEYPIPPEGDVTIKIEAAELTDDDKYNIYARDLYTDVKFRLTYWMTYVKRVEGGAEGDVKVLPNSRSMATLVSLGKALAGAPIGVPFYTDIEGGVVTAEIKHGVSKKTGNKFPICYKFKPASESMVLAFSELHDEEGEIAQYSIPDDDMTEEVEQ